MHPLLSIHQKVLDLKKTPVLNIITIHDSNILDVAQEKVHKDKSFAYKM